MSQEKEPLFSEEAALDYQEGELLDAPVFEGELIEDDENDPLLSELSTEEGQEASVYAVFFLKKLVRIRGVRISREDFLRQELQKAHLSESQIEEAIASDPISVGISQKRLDKLANHAISYETKKSTALSFVAGIPGGLAMLGTVPADLGQYYVHSLRIMQKLAYLYGWKEFLTDPEDVDDETIAQMGLFFGVMLGVAGAAESMRDFARMIVAPAIEKRVARKALMKGTWYPVVKKSLKVIGISVTKQGFTKTMSKILPLIGGVISGGMTFVSLQTQANRLKQHLRQLPPPATDGAEWKQANNSGLLLPSKHPPCPANQRNLKRQSSIRKRLCARRLAFLAIVHGHLDVCREDRDIQRARGQAGQSPRQWKRKASGNCQLGRAAHQGVGSCIPGETPWHNRVVNLRCLEMHNPCSCEQKCMPVCCFH